MRALRRARQARDAAEAAAAQASSSSEEESSSSSSRGGGGGGGVVNPFMMLGASDDDEDEDEDEDYDDDDDAADEDDDEEGSKGGMGASGDGAAREAHAVPGDGRDKDADGNSNASDSDSDEVNVHMPEPGLMAKNKQKKAKNKQKVVQAGHDDDDDDESSEDIDAVLAELGPAPGAGAGTGQGAGEAGTSAAGAVHFLAVETRMCNAEAEMKRVFGSSSLGSSGGGNGAATNQHPLMRNRDPRNQRNKVRHRRSVLTSPQQSWPRCSDVGIRMEFVGADAQGVKTFAFVTDDAYDTVEMMFQAAASTHDPNNIMAVCIQHPYHMGALLQLGDVYKQTGEMDKAAEMAARAVYGFECCFSPDFNPYDGTCRIEYEEDIDCQFHEALFRHMLFTGRKGCVRTALELGKLLLSLSPDEDPKYVYFLVDFYALRSHQYSFVHSVMAHAGGGHMDLLPNWALNGAVAQLKLALKAAGGKRTSPVAMPPKQEQGKDKQTKEEEDKGEEEDAFQVADKVLQHALLLFPSAVVAILKKAGITWTDDAPPPDAPSSSSSMSNIHLGEYFGKASSKSATLNHLVDIYAHRNYAIWKEPEVTQWLRDNVAVCLRRVEGNDPAVKEYEALRRDEYPPSSSCRFVLNPEEYADSQTTTIPDDEGPGAPARQQRVMAAVPENPVLGFFHTLMPWNR